MSAYSPLGKAGEWLLDPNDITIIDTASEGSTAGVVETPPPPELVFYRQHHFGDRSGYRHRGRTERGHVGDRRFQ
ncbi:MAG: hypothetical protein MZV65_48250 [Chromatiales bacterium]|nr:hypothetical protein [Chromatiales bacterium]